MHRLRAQQFRVFNVQEALDEFADRAQEFGIPDSDIISVSAWPTSAQPLDSPKESAVTMQAPLEVAITYWSNE